jgi:hypothetical protein
MMMTFLLILDAIILLGLVKNKLSWIFLLMDKTLQEISLSHSTIFLISTESLQWLDQILEIPELN